MGKPEKTGDDLNMRIERDALRHQTLRPAVKQDNDKSNQNVEGSRRVLGHPKFVACLGLTVYRPRLETS